MVFIKTYSNYNLFDGSYNPDCTDCSAMYCSYPPFASFDASGVLMNYVVVGSSLHGPSTWPSVWNSWDTYYSYEQDTDIEPTPKSIEPYYFNAAPCCYKVEILGTTNNSIDTSWCQQCNRLNIESHSSVLSSIESHSNSVYGIHHNQNYMHTFELCHPYPDTLDIIDENMSKICKNDHAPCMIKHAHFYLNVEDAIVPEELPDIVAYFWLVGTKIKYASGTFSYYYHLEYSSTIVGGWRKVIDKYHGDYNQYKIGFTTSQNYLNSDNGNRGIFDGRQFSTTFNSSNLIVDFTPYSGYILPSITYWYQRGYGSADNVHLYEIDRLSNFCNYDNTIINITPSEQVGQINNCDTYYTNNLYDICNNEHIYASSLLTSFGYDYWGMNYITPISNSVAISISGIVGIDDDKNLLNLNIQSCQKCSNLNNTFVLKTANQIGIPYDYYTPPVYSYNLPLIGSNTNNGLMIDMCCDCPGSSICIQDIGLYFVQDSGYEHPDFIDTYIKLDMYDTIHPYPIARFQKHLDSSPSTQPRFKLNCNNLFIDNMVFESGIIASEDSWQRCIFDNATISAQFKPIDNLDMTCKFEPYNCLICADGYSPISIAAEITGLTWNSPTGINLPYCSAYVNGTSTTLYTKYCESFDDDLYVLQQNFYSDDALITYPYCTYEYSFPAPTGYIDMPCSYSEYYMGGFGCFTSIKLTLSGSGDYTIVNLHLHGSVYGRLIEWETTLLNTGSTPYSKDMSIFDIETFLAHQTAYMSSGVSYIDCNLLDGLVLPLKTNALGDVGVVRCMGLDYNGWPSCYETPSFNEWLFDGSPVTLHIV